MACGSHEAPSGVVGTTGGDGAGEAGAPSDAGVADESPVADDDASYTFGSTDGAEPYAGCQPGNYAGTYTGTFQTIIPVTGPVTIDLVPQTQQQGELALVTNGGTFYESWGLMLADASNSIVVTNATLMGQLDCTNGMFAATAPDAMFTIAGVPSGMSMLNFSGTYDAATSTISGSFTTTSMLGDSMGTWTVTRMP